MSKTWIYVRVTQIILDVIGVYASFLLAYLFRVGFIFSSDFSFTLFAAMSAAATFLWSGFMIFAKYYRIPPRSGKRMFFDITLIFIGGAIANGFLIVSYFFPQEILFSRLISVYSFLFGCSFLLLSQFLFRKILASFKKKEKKVYRTLIIGANRVTEKLIKAITNDAYAPYKIIGVIDPYGLESQIKGSVILGKLDKLETVSKQEGITAIIQCDAFEHTLNIISFCDEKNIKFQFDPALRGIFEDNLRIRETAGINLLSFVQRDYSGAKKLRFKFIDSVLRQVFDID